MNRATHRPTPMTGARAIVLAAALLGATLAGTISLPAMRTQLDAAATTQDRAATIEQQTSDAARLRADHRATARAAALHTALPADAQLGAALAQLQSAVNGSGADWVSADADPGTAIEMTLAGTRHVLTSYAITLRVHADAAQMGALLHGIDTLPRRAVVDGFSLNGRAGTPSSIDLRVFSLDEKK